jgi:hypothetical protein
VHSAGGAVRHVRSSKARKFLRNDGFGRPHAMALYSQKKIVLAHFKESVEIVKKKRRNDEAMKR